MKPPFKLPILVDGTELFDFDANLICDTEWADEEALQYIELACNNHPHLIKMVERLLAVPELNEDEMDENTCLLIGEARNYLKALK